MGLGSDGHREREGEGTHRRVRVLVAGDESVVLAATRTMIRGFPEIER
jgi:hypothetical protein